VTNLLGENSMSHWQRYLLLAFEILCYATPAISGGSIFIKGRSYLWCIGKK
jgi:hypothetical protein